MRGKPIWKAASGRGIGITPADAGKTKSPPGGIRRAWDHPRGCGENLPTASIKHFRTGSPPRMRGKPAVFAYGGSQYRITPADAGKTPALTGFIGAGWDHPRGCGENYDASRKGILALGSPPRMRGKPDNHRCRSLVDGITPADAGKTLTIFSRERRI